MRMEKLNLLKKNVQEPTENMMCEYLSEDDSKWWRNPFGLWEVVVELPRNDDKYRYFLCQDKPNHISIRRIKK